ncbi:MAG: hypothetical protein EAZ97_14735 [Bacteroidetes bacterium]|nr:MAG: hypothetical protein EAZ97_14735 [Bacteroidota bacterium]
MTAKQYLTLFFLLIFASNILAQKISKKVSPMPQNLLEQKECIVFLKGRNILSEKHLELPNSPYLLVYLAVQREEEQDRWSPDKADHISAKIFVYDLDTGKINEKLSLELNEKLGADKHYNLSFCGGLGSANLEKMEVVGNHIFIPQMYNPGTMPSTCYQKVIFSMATKKIIVKMGGNEPANRRKN